MKNFYYAFALVALVIFTDCKKDDVESVVLRSKEYSLNAVGNSGVTGKVTFTEDSNGTTEVLIELTGSDTSKNPAFIRFNGSTEGGAIALTLTSCECSVGHTVVSKLDGGTSISYDGLLKLDGHVSVHGGPKDLLTIVAVANIGTNAE